MNNSNDFELKKLIVRKKQSLTEQIEIPHNLLIDGKKMETADDVNKLLTQYSKINVINKNTLIHVSLCVNLREYLFLTHECSPTLISF